jgi:hypothetical protein
MRGFIMSEVRIRKIDAGALARIDELANNSGKSRNAFLKNYIETLSVLEQLKEQEEKYANLVKAVADVVEHNTQELERMRIFLQLN